MNRCLKCAMIEQREQPVDLSLSPHSRTLPGTLLPGYAPFHWRSSHYRHRRWPEGCRRRCLQECLAFHRLLTKCCRVRIGQQTCLEPAIVFDSSLYFLSCYRCCVVVFLFLLTRCGSSILLCYSPPQQI